MVGIEKYIHWNKIGEMNGMEFIFLGRRKAVGEMNIAKTD